MNALHFDLQCPDLKNTLSLADLTAKLFPEKDKCNRAPVISEERYSPKTLVGNWFEHRAVCVPQPNDWRTLYDIEYKAHVNEAWKENQVAQWDNKLNLEGVPRGQLLDWNGKACYNNMTTTYDLSYNILPRGLDGPRIRSYNTSAQDLAKCYGNLTQFGLRDILKNELYKNSQEGIAKCRWWSTYREEIGLSLNHRSEGIKRNTQFNKRRVDMNVPNLKHFERKTSDIQSCLLPFRILSSTNNSE